VMTGIFFFAFLLVRERRARAFNHMYFLIQ
jgi:hypothetical protein